MCSCDVVPLTSEAALQELQENCLFFFILFFYFGKTTFHGTLGSAFREVGVDWAKELSVGKKIVFERFKNSNWRSQMSEREKNTSAVMLLKNNQQQQEKNSS